MEPNPIKASNVALPESMRAAERQAATSVQLHYPRPTAHLAAPMSSDEMQAWWRTADAFVTSRMFKGVEDVAQAYVKILLGRDLGLNPAQAMMSIDLVRGNLQLRGTLLARMIRESPHYDYERVESDDEHCVTDFYGISKRTGEWTLLGREEFSIADAQKAKIMRADGAWFTWPRNMLFWRTISNGVKMHMPDLLGGVPVYTEADDFREIPAIGAAQQDVVEPGWQGVSVADAAEVEKVLRRAEKLGHAGYTNRAAVQMALNGQSREVVAEWIANANDVLDQWATRQADDARIADGTAAGMVASWEATAAHEGYEPETGAQGYAVSDDPHGHSADAAHEEAARTAQAEQQQEPIEGQEALDVGEDQTDPEEQARHDLDAEIALARTAVAAAKNESEERERRAHLADLEARKAER